MGILRVYLALSVVVFHFSFGPESRLGAAFAPPDVAVWCFFILSGFYISLGLNERYAGPGGNRAFYLGRVARLWPTYALSLLLLTAAADGRNFVATLRQLPFFDAAAAVVANAVIAGLDVFLHVAFIDGHIAFAEYGLDRRHNGAGLILNFPAWTLAIEVTFYLLAPFVVRNRWRVLAFLAMGLAWSLYFAYVRPDLQTRFRSDIYFPGTMAYFGLGMVAYGLYRTRGATAIAAHALAAAALASAYWAGLGTWPLAYGALALLCGTLFELTRGGAVDRFLGDLSYPIYILHYPIGKLVFRFMGDSQPAVPVLIATVATATAVVVWIERPIDRWRARAWARVRQDR